MPGKTEKLNIAVYHSTIVTEPFIIKPMMKGLKLAIMLAFHLEKQTQNEKVIWKTLNISESMESRSRWKRQSKL